MHLPLLVALNANTTTWKGVNGCFGCCLSMMVISGIRPIQWNLEALVRLMRNGVMLRRRSSS